METLLLDSQIIECINNIIYLDINLDPYGYQCQKQNREMGESSKQRNSDQTEGKVKERP